MGKLQRVGVRRVRPGAQSKTPEFPALKSEPRWEPELVVPSP